MSRHPSRSIAPRRALSRVAIACAFGISASAVAASRIPPVAATLAGWNAAGLVLLTLSWAIIAPADARSTRDHAGSEDPGRTLVYAIVVLTSTVSLLAANVLLRSTRSAILAFVLNLVFWMATWIHVNMTIHFCISSTGAIQITAPF